MRNWLISADWHLRGDRPRCRTDEDWIGTQRACIREIFDLALEMGAPLFLVGDIFNTSRIATEALCMAVEEFARFKVAGGEVYILAGNHDLPYHDYNLVQQSSFGVLRGLVPEIHMHPFADAGHMTASPFGKDDPKACEFAFTHRLVFPDKASIPPGCEAATAQEVLKEFESRLVFTGDYHHSFSANARTKWCGQSRLLINPGCINRQSADMVDYKPVVACVDIQAPTESCLSWIPLKADSIGANVSVEHILMSKERDARIEAFVEKIRTNRELSLSFMDNLNARLPSTPAGVQSVTQEIIQRSMEQKGQI